jgi:hypothetical protein
VYADWTLPRGTPRGNAHEKRGAGLSIESGLARYSTRSRVGAGSDAAAASADVLLLVVSTKLDPKAMWSAKAMPTRAAMAPYGAIAASDTRKKSLKFKSPNFNVLDSSTQMVERLATKA